MQLFLEISYQNRYEHVSITLQPLEILYSWVSQVSFACLQITSCIVFLLRQGPAGQFSRAINLLVMSNPNVPTPLDGVPSYVRIRTKMEHLRAELERAQEHYWRMVVRSSPEELWLNGENIADADAYRRSIRAEIDNLHDLLHQSYATYQQLMTWQRASCTWTFIAQHYLTCIFYSQDITCLINSILGQVVCLYLVQLLLGILPKTPFPDFRDGCLTSAF